MARNRQTVLSNRNPLPAVVARLGVVLFTAILLVLLWGVNARYLGLWWVHLVPVGRLAAYGRTLEDPDQLETAARRLFFAGRAEEAYALLKPRESRWANRSEFQYLIGRVADAAGHPLEGAVHLRSAADQRTDHETLYRLAAVLIRIGETGEARERLERVTRIVWRRQDAWLDLMQLHVEEDRPGEAIQTMIWITDAESIPRGLALKARALAATGQAREALELARTCWENPATPEDQRPHLAAILASGSDPKVLNPAVQRLLTEGDRAPHELWLREAGRGLLKLRRPKDALSALCRHLRAAPLDQVGYQLLAEAALTAELASDARRLRGQAKQLLARSHALDAATESFRKSRVKGEAHYVLARKCRDLGLLDWAEREAAAALTLRPDHLGAQRLKNELTHGSETATGRTPALPTGCCGSGAPGVPQG